MSVIAENIRSLKNELPPSVKLVAVSKSKPASDILTAYNAGQLCFGENRVQELLQKKEILPSDIEWHLIGHLQSNKVKYIVSFISMIESIDSFRLLTVVNDEASRIHRIVDCLLQIKIAEEETKYGFSFGEINEMLESDEIRLMNAVRICGVMGMGTLTDDEQQTRTEFRLLANFFAELKNKYFVKNSDFSEISMGMSGDYKIALDEGTTMVRIGNLIFGKRFIS